MPAMRVASRNAVVETGFLCAPGAGNSREKIISARSENGGRRAKAGKFILLMRPVCHPTRFSVSFLQFHKLLQRLCGFLRLLQLPISSRQQKKRTRVVRVQRNRLL